MGQSITVYSVEALDELNTALLRYQDYALRSLEEAAIEIRRALDWLAERQNFWRNEVRRRREAVRQATAAFDACKARIEHEARGGRTYQLDCTQEWRAVERSKLFLGEAEHELRVVTDMLAQVQRAHKQYQREVQRLTTLLRHDVPRTVVLLKGKVAILRSTFGGSSLGGAPLPGRSDPEVTAAAATLVNAGVAVFGVVDAISQVLSIGQSERAQSGWVERGIQRVPVDQIDLTDSYVEGPSDYKKVPYAVMVEGTRKFAETVLPAVQKGASADDFDELDRQNGLEYEQGYRRVYDAFYGNDPIRLEKIGNVYKVVGGYHRLYIAKQLGLSAVPASVVEKL